MHNERKEAESGRHTSARMERIIPVDEEIGALRTEVTTLTEQINRMVERVKELERRKEAKQ